MATHCTYSKILNPDETSFVKHLFLSTGKRCPESSIMACIDNSKNKGPYDCRFRYEFGYNIYCGNPERIKEHLNKITDRLPTKDL